MTLEELVMQILAEDERARDDDLWLLWRVYNELSYTFIPFEDFRKLPKPESVSRIRRHIQNDLGLYPGRKVLSRQRKAVESRKYWGKLHEEARV